MSTLLDILLNAYDWPDDQAGTAARAAAIELVKNWAPVLGDGQGPEALARDVSRVIGDLREWEAAAAALIARKYRCPGCELVFLDLGLVQRWPREFPVDRLVPGDEVPVGACPACREQVRARDVYLDVPVAIAMEVSQ